MWILCGGLSVVFCIIGWIMMPKKKIVSQWASVCSLAFVSLTLLMEYRMVLQWVNKEDWSALMDVVPPMFSFYARYVIILLLANAVLMGVICMKKKDL